MKEKDQIMKPKTNLVLDRNSLDSLKRNIKSISLARKQREQDPSFHLAYPEYIGVKLTHKCNMRCIHCYQWNSKGHNHFFSKEMQNQEIDVSIMEKLIYETSKNKARFYLWGGEPLFHSKFADIAALFEKDPRETVICTNGLLVPKYIDNIIKMGAKTELVLSVEGFEDTHDSFRGKGSFKKVIETLDFLLELRKKKLYYGKIYVHMMINDDMSNSLFDFAEYLENKGVDFLIFCFPWYISQENSLAMDDFFKNNFPGEVTSQLSSWHGFKYSMNLSSVPKLISQIQKINEKMWNMRIRFQPDLDYSEIPQFIEDKYTKNCSQKCLGLSSRIDVSPNGDVSACKQFAEFYVGNLYESSLSDIWNGEKYNIIRKTIGNNLMPVCTKCSNLFVHNM